MLVEACEMKEKPQNLAATTVLGMVEDLCWKIKEKVPADKQEEVILKFFKALGSCKSLEDLAAKAVNMVKPAEMKKEVEDSEEKEDDILDFYVF